jgi:hypothetical protein
MTEDSVKIHHLEQRVMDLENNIREIKELILRGKCRTYTAPLATDQQVPDLPYLMTLAGLLGRLQTIMARHPDSHNWPVVYPAEDDWRQVQVTPWWGSWF